MAKGNRPTGDIYSKLYDKDGYRGVAVIGFSKYTNEYSPVVSVREINSYDDDGNELQNPVITNATYKGGFFKTRGEAIDWLKKNWDGDVKIPKY